MTRPGVRTMTIQVTRLRAGDASVARRLFALMAEVFGEARGDLSDEYLARVLSDERFWVFAASVGDDLLGGLTAHALPMTRSEAAELFVYDVAVRPEHQRQGVGSQLMGALRAQGALAGIHDVFVAAAAGDVHALDFYRALGGVASPATVFTFAGDPS